MVFMQKKIKIVTHPGKFHADDVFGTATLLLLLGETVVEIIRTRNEVETSKADYVLDTGFVYDSETKRFDHHQPEGGGKRENGIPYAAFGLVWKEYGHKVAGSTGAADEIDKTLVQPIDAMDNGVDIYTSLFDGVRPLAVQEVIRSYRPTWKEKQDYDVAFLKALSWAKEFLAREIVIYQDFSEASQLVQKAYGAADNKQLVVLEDSEDIGREIVTRTLMKYPEPLYAVLWRGDVDAWQVVAVNKSANTYETRKPMPENWWGKRGDNFDRATGINDGVFCHRNGFMCVTESKESALKLAKLALEADE